MRPFGAGREEREGPSESHRRAIVWLALGMALSTPALAQTTDTVFAGWRWAPEGLGSRPAGLGGAFVAVADSNKATYANPAGLALIPAWEVSLSTNQTWLGVAGGGIRWVRLAAYAAQTDEARVEQGAPAGAPGASLESSVWEVGLGVGAQPLRRIKLGGSLAWSRLSIDGRRTELSPTGEATVVTTVTSDDVHPRASVGMLMTLLGSDRRSLPSLRLGVAYQPGFDWSARIEEGTGSAPRPIGIRRPSVVLAGLAFRPADRWMFTAQGDLVRNREVLAALRRNVGSDAPGFSIPDTLEPRLGTEFSAPLWCGCGIVSLRGGLAFRPPGTLVYEGEDEAASAAFRSGTWRTVTSLGASFVTEHFGNALRFDVDSRDLFDGPELSFGIVWRF
jgi:hypothetical protein